MIRYGLCCAFRDQPIRFRAATASAALRLSRPQQLQRLGDFALQNAAALGSAIEFCGQRGIGCFRVSSQILPLRTHPTIGYRVENLPGGDEIIAEFSRCGSLAARLNVRLTFHPDQFVVLNSPRAEVVRASVEELVAQNEIAEWIGADVIIIHAGGAYGDRPAALERLRRTLDELPRAVRMRLALENDDRVFSPADLLPLCERSDVPLVYDVHHHRCHGDNLSVAEATRRAIATWDREPLMHLSSPAGGWNCDNPRVHDDWIDVSDFPSEWTDVSATVEIEARAKEAAVLRLMRERIAVTLQSDRVSGGSALAELTRSAKRARE